MRRTTRWTAMVAALVGLAAPAAGQDKFPARAVQIVSAAPPGGTVDLHSRAIAPILERYLKQPVVVVAKTGAAGAVAFQFVAASKPDGYTILMEMLKHAAGIQMRHVPFTGGGPAMTALLGGHIDTLVTVGSVALPQVKAGAVRVLAAWGARRGAAWPGVPTLKELGYDVEFYLWVGLFAPGGTPPPVLRVLREAVRQAVGDADFTAAMAKVETPIDYRDGEGLQKFWDQEYKSVGEAIRRVGKVETK